MGNCKFLGTFKDELGNPLYGFVEQGTFGITKKYYNANTGVLYTGVVYSEGGDTYLIIQIDETTPNITYLGKAKLNSLDNQSVWQIRLIDSTTPITTIKYADGVQTFTKIWDDRAIYSYS